MLLPWNDRSGRLSPLKAVALLSALVPAVWILIQWQQGWLGPRQLNEAIHQTGSWSVRFLLATLAVTPLRHIGGWTKLISIRRILGLTALAYGLAHLGLYAVDQHLDLAKIASEIALRTYLTIGFVALLGMAAMGATSTDGMIRRLGTARWRRLHAIVHGVAVLSILHFFMQSKIDASEAALMLGFLVLLELYRVMIRLRMPLKPVPLGLAAVAGAVTAALLEAGWYEAATKVAGRAVLEANLYFDVAIRPSWWVLAVGLAVAVLGASTASPPARRGRETQVGRPVAQSN